MPLPLAAHCLACFPPCSVRLCTIYGTNTARLPRNCPGIALILPRNCPVLTEVKLSERGLGVFTCVINIIPMVTSDASAIWHRLTLLDFAPNCPEFAMVCFRGNLGQKKTGQFRGNFSTSGRLKRRRLKRRRLLSLRMLPKKSKSNSSRSDSTRLLLLLVLTMSTRVCTSLLLVYNCLLRIIN